MYNNEFYQNLKKPAITPKPVVFKYVWLILYLMMFTALYIILRLPDSIYRNTGLVFFTIQFLLNIVWSPVFFILQDMKLSFSISLFLALFVALTVFVFSKLSVLAAILLIPYLLWSVFACFLLLQFIKINCK